MWLFALLFSREYMAHYEHKARYYIFMLATFASTALVFVSGDLLTLFVFFEVMSISSYVLVIHDETKECMRAGETYLAVAVIGSMVMLMGLFLLYNLLGTLSLGELAEAAKPYKGTKELYVPCGLIMFGFGAKAGIFPLHIWLPKAHPVAPAPASAILSGILTKAGIFGALILSCIILAGDHKWGKVLAILGMVTMLTGAVLALFSVNLKRTLACSSVSQIGFITVGIGLMCMLGDENLIAARGTVLHMVNHSMIKLLLFCCAGAIYMKVHELNLNKLRGYGRNKNGLKALFAVGALSISGIPLFSGYVSKTLLHEGILEYMHHSANSGEFVIFEKLFLFAGGLTLAYMLKLFICIFVEKNADSALQAKYDSIKPAMSGLSAISLGAPAAVLLAMGFLPHLVMDGISNICMPFLGVAEHLWKGDAAYEHYVNYFSLENLKGSAISIVIGLAVYFLIIRPLLTTKDENGNPEFLDRWPKKLDLEDLIYRPLIAAIVKVLTVACGILADLTDDIVKAVFACILKPIGREEKGESAFSAALRRFSAENGEFESTLSFGLTLALIGLCILLAVCLF